MPVIYVSTHFHASVVLTPDDDFVFQQWTDADLAKERAQYGHPDKAIWLQIVNPEDEVEVFPINITGKDLYEGSLEVVRNGREFSFTLHGKAKVNVHKSTKEKIDSGLTPRVAGLNVNGQQYGVDLPIDVVIQSKKL